MYYANVSPGIWGGILVGRTSLPLTLLYLITHTGKAHASINGGLNRPKTANSFYLQFFIAGAFGMAASRSPSQRFVRCNEL